MCRFLVEVAWYGVAGTGAAGGGCVVVVYSFWFKLNFLFPIRYRNVLKKKFYVENCTTRRIILR